MSYKPFVFFIFIGSVFFTSDKFVSTENDIKFYFTIISFLVVLLITSLQKNIATQQLKRITTLPVLKGLFVIGVLQASYGILQYIGKFPSNHNSFAITGSFDNPAGFVAVLSLLCPIGIWWVIKTSGLERRLVVLLTAIMIIPIFLIGSRTGFLAIIVSSIFILLTEIKRVVAFKYSAQILILCIPVILFGSWVLFNFKQDSAKGRILIWKVTWEMIKEKPLFGHGYNSVEANYMNYQALYFKEHSQSKYKLLADNVKHPFNEFIKVTVNYGIIGLLLYLALICFFFWRLLNTDYWQKRILMGIYISFIVLSCFSYPLHYPPVWLFLSYCVIILFSEKLFEKRLYIVGKMVLSVICIGGIVFFSFLMVKEMQWKTIAVNSLQGKTLKMLSEYEKLYPYLKKNALFLYNYGAELNVAKDYNKSILILLECMNHFNDYDLQMILADNYYKIGKLRQSVEAYQNASNMIPSKFLPLFRLFQIYNEQNQKEMALKYARQIQRKKVKIPSSTVLFIQNEANEFLNVAKYENNSEDK